MTFRDSAAHAAVHILLAAAILVGLAGCATGPKLVWHSFSIDAWFDGWARSISLLEYRYENGNRLLNKRNENGVPHSWGVTAAMPVADYLYVRWRIKETGEVLEKTVDLRGRLPKNMFRAEVTFVIDGRDLYVYVVIPESVGAQSDTVPMKTFLSRYRKTYEIFPGR